MCCNPYCSPTLNSLEHVVWVCMTVPTFCFLRPQHITHTSNPMKPIVATPPVSPDIAKT